MQNSVNEDQEKQDQSQKTVMEDSTAMTIEFLRARLQSERSISRTAKHRADELAKRVVELEEQLKIASLQRKKAEKATAEVLEILENNGIGDFSEAYDSSSDHEGILCESKDGNHSAKEEKSSTSSRPRRKEVEDMSQLEASPITSRSLSWKSCNGSPDSLEKKGSDHARRRSSFMPIRRSSTKPHLGKSRRHIKQRETRSAATVGSVESLPLDAHKNGVATGPGDVSDRFKEMPQIIKEGSLEGPSKENNDGFYCNVDGRDVDMERALEHQALLIGKHEAEENAQREWEQKFRENNSCTPDSCEPGNRSDITEERDEIRVETAEPADTILSHGQAGESGVERVCYSGEVTPKTLPNGFLPPPHIDIGSSHDLQCNGLKVNTEFSFPSHENLETKSNGKHYQDQSAQKSSSFHVDGSFYKGESSGMQNELQVTTYHGTPILGGVLEALQRAKLSLKHELHRLPLPTQGGHMVRVMDTPVPAIKAGDDREIPVGCAGLFSVPTSWQSGTTTTTRNNLLRPFYSDSGSSLARYQLPISLQSERNIANQTNLLGPYSGMGVGVTAGHQFISSPNLEMGSGISSRRPLIDDHSMNNGMGLPASSRYTYPNADLVPRMPPNNGFPRPYPSVRSGIPTSDRYPLYEDQNRLNAQSR